MNKCKEEQLKGGEKEMKDDVTQNFPGEEPTYKKGGKTMKTKMKKLMKNQKGMTLIELLAVIVIIAIIALIANPAIGNIISNSKDKAILSDASQIISSAKIALSDGACDGTSTGVGNTDVAGCNQNTLKDYVEKEDLPSDATFYVTKSKSEYTIFYSEFSKLKDDGKFSAIKTAKNIVKSTDLAKYMKDGKISK